MIVYYKTCQRCYKLLPSNIPMIIRDTDISQVIEGPSMKATYLVPGDTLSVFHPECMPR